MARNFYTWLLSLVNFKYQEVICECKSLSKEQMQNQACIAEKLILTIMQLSIPVIDIENYRLFSATDP